MSDFAGSIGRSREESTPWWPPRTQARPGSPNIVIVYMDDMGFSDPGCYGSEIATPHIDALASRGLLFNHYTTHPICTSARAALLTGKNAHAVGSGWLANNNPGYPGYVGEIPLDAATLAETLRAAGYETIMTGKWHNTPGRDTVPSGMKHNWPAQRGFDTFYGFMDGETHFFFPTGLMLNNQLAPIDEYPPDYYATDDWTDKAIQYVKELRASSQTKPFFLYIAHNAPHAPMQAKASDIARYEGRYDEGWDALREARYRRQLELGIIPKGTRLAPRDESVPRWADTDPEDRALFARHMEVYAAMLDCVDQNVGKLVDFLRETGELDNTIIVFSSDNGGTDAGGPAGMFNNNRRLSGLPALAAAEERAKLMQLGGPESVALYPAGWGQACNTPFSSYKTYTGGGGRRVPFIVSWPRGIQDRGLRTQFAHVTDVMPTLLDLAGVEPLKEIHGRPPKKMDGMSVTQVLKANAPSPHVEQYYECWSNRAYYCDGWLACSLQKHGAPIDMDNWTLHILKDDFSESMDVSAQHPDKLRELVSAFDKAAWENMVYPLDNRSRPERFFDGPPVVAGPVNAKVIHAGTQTVHRLDVLKLIADRSFRIVTNFSCDGDEGVLWSIGDPTGGMILFVEDGALHFHYNGFGARVDLPAVAVPQGAASVTLEYEALGKRRGRGRLLVGSQALREWTDMSPTLSFGILEGLDVGLDRRGPVDRRLYERRGSFRYTGEITSVRIEPGE